MSGLVAVLGSATPPGRLRRAVAATPVEKISAAEAVLPATPVYRGSPTGVLKNLLDRVPVEALEREPVAIVAIGATQHHYFEDGAPTGAAGAELDALVAELRDRAATAFDEAARLRPLIARRPLR